jgi:hypothetical protein
MACKEIAMRTNEHWDECNHVTSYLRAQNVALELKDIAKNSGYDPRGIKVLGKKEAIRRNIGRVGAIITWDEGPEEWPETCELSSDICVPYKGIMLLFYD